MEKIISPQYAQKFDEFERWLQVKAEKEELKASRPAHLKFYFFVFFFIIFNYFASSSCFEIYSIKFSPIQGWNVISLTFFELVFLLVFGARCGINHLSTLVDKIVSHTRRT